MRLADEFASVSSMQHHKTRRDFYPLLPRAISVMPVYTSYHLRGCGQQEPWGQERAKIMGNAKKLLIMGLPGAGKTTLAKLLGPRLNAVHFNADEVRTH